MHDFCVFFFILFDTPYQTGNMTPNDRVIHSHLIESPQDKMDVLCNVDGRVNKPLQEASSLTIWHECWSKPLAIINVLDCRGCWPPCSRVRKL